MKNISKQLFFLAAVKILLWVISFLWIAHLLHKEEIMLTVSFMVVFNLGCTFFTWHWRLPGPLPVDIWHYQSVTLTKIISATSLIIQVLWIYPENKIVAILLVVYTLTFHVYLVMVSWTSNFEEVELNAESVRREQSIPKKG